MSLQHRQAELDALDEWPNGADPHLVAECNCDHCAALVELAREHVGTIEINAGEPNIEDKTDPAETGPEATQAGLTDFPGGGVNA